MRNGPTRRSSAWRITKRYRSRGLQPDDRGRAGRTHRSDRDKVGEPLRPDDLPEIVLEEACVAETVRKIYRLFIQGKTVNWIAKHLTAKGIPTPRGKAKWQTSTIESILTNEKYKGSAILQKKFTVDFLSKKMKVNEGEAPQYILEESHPAIIDPDQWKKEQDEMAVCKAKGRYHNCLSPLSAKQVCGDCREYYGSKVWHSTVFCGQRNERMKASCMKETDGCCVINVSQTEDSNGPAVSRKQKT